MSEDPKITTSATAEHRADLNLTEVLATVDRLQRDRERHLLALLTAVKVIPDLQGFMVGDDDYAVVVGRGLWERLQAQCK